MNFKEYIVENNCHNIFVTINIFKKVYKHEF